MDKCGISHQRRDCPARLSRELSMCALRPHRDHTLEADFHFPLQIAIMIFVLSALHPDEWARAVENTWKVCLNSRSSVLAR